MRAIDADALKEWIDEYVSVFKKSDTREIKGYIEHQPTIDAVSVVRCKECKWARPTATSEDIYCEPYKHYRYADGFCSYGEVRDE